MASLEPLAGKGVRENIAGIQQRNQGDVPGVGDILGNQHVLDTQTELVPGLAVNHHVALGAGGPREFLLLVFQYAALHKVVKRRLLYGERFVFG